MSGDVIDVVGFVAGVDALSGIDDALVVGVLIVFNGTVDETTASVVVSTPFVSVFVDIAIDISSTCLTETATKF